MRITLQANELNGVPSSVIFEPVPDTCPRCHRSVVPKVGQACVQAAQRWAQVIYQCTSEKCLELFIGSYTYHNTLTYPLYKLVRVSPINAKAQDFPAAKSLEFVRRSAGLSVPCGKSMA